MKDFKYKLTFASQIKPITEGQTNEFLSLASNQQFKKFIPSELGDNPSMLLFAGEAFLANRLNENMDGVATDEAITIAKLLPFTYCDLSHNRHNLAGVIVSANFTEVGNGKNISIEKIKEMKLPFSVTIGGVIWKAPNPDLVDELENSKDPCYISWEIGFSKMNLIEIDKGEYDFVKGKIITDQDKVEELSKNLLCYGGKGILSNGKKIGRLPTGDDLVALGVGLVTNPAANVQSIYVDSSNKSNLDNSTDSSEFEYKPDLQSVNRTNTKPNNNMDKVEDNKVEDVTKDKQPDFTLDSPSLKKLIKFYKKDKIKIDKYGNELAASIDRLCTSKLEKLSFGACPECGELGDGDTKRYANGKTYCGSCGYMTASKDWKIEEIKNIEFIEKNKTILKDMFESHKNNQLSKEDYLEQLENYLDVFKGQSPTKEGENDSDLEKIDKNKLIDKNVNILSASLIEMLKNLPEDGMGYQKVDLEMNDGSIIKEIIVRNCSILPENINASNIKNIKKSANSISQAQNAVVKDNNKYMKIDKIDQVTDDNLKEIKASELKEIFASNIKTTLDAEIEKISKDYTTKLTEKDNLIKAANESTENIKKQVETLNSTITTVQANYDKLVKENDEKAKVEAFSSRMEVVEDKFDFNDKQKEAIANEIKVLGTDKDFTDYLTKMELLFEKNKKVANNTTQTATASVTDDNKTIKTAISNGEKKDAEIPNSSSAEETLKQKFQKAFGIDGWQIVNKRTNRIM